MGRDRCAGDPSVPRIVGSAVSSVEPPVVHASLLPAQPRYPSAGPVGVGGPDVELRAVMYALPEVTSRPVVQVEIVRAYGFIAGVSALAGTVSRRFAGQKYAGDS